MSKVGIVYATGSGILRRVIIPDGEGALSDGTHAVAAGETMLIVTRAEYDNAHAQADGTPQGQPEARLLHQKTGKAWASARCAVIDQTGTVAHVIAADPALDAVPGMTLVLSDVALPGWTWTAQGGFVAPVVLPSTSALP